jgi:alpha-L-rhamnosidase
MVDRPRPPFIWLADQPIRPRAALGGGKPRTEPGNRWVMFRRTYMLESAEAEGTLRVTTDGRYRLFVNGEEAGRGPVRSSPLFKRYDTLDISTQLRDGANTIAVLVHTYGEDTAFHEGVRGLWRPVFGEGGLWIEGAVETARGVVLVGTDTHWRCKESFAWDAQAPRVNDGLGFIESLDSDELPAGWRMPGFDDSTWPHAAEQVAGGGGPESFFGGMSHRPFPVLMPSEIPALRRRFEKPVRTIWMKGQRSDPDLPLERRLYTEPLTALAHGAIDRPEGFLDGDAVIVHTAPGVDVSILLDFGRIITGHPRFEITGQGGEVVEIACSEHLPGEWSEGGPSPGGRITPRPLLGLDAHLCRYRARPGVQDFEQFEWSAVRWMQVVIRNAPRGVRLRGLGVTTVNYPVDRRGRFECSDPLLNRLWRMGAYTLEMCMHDAWEDCPSREQRQWLGDATVENLVGWAAFGPSVEPLNRKFLRQAAESQRPDGLTQMYAPGDHHTDRLLIPDWTLQWILNAADHYQHTGDVDLAAELLPSVQRALRWFELQLGPQGLVADMPYWHFMDWSGVGRQGLTSPLNAQLAGAFRSAALLARACGYERLATAYTRRALTIGAAIEALHWDERRGVYVDMVDPASSRQDPRVSQHAAAAIALWGTSDDARMARALARIIEPSRLTFTAAPPIAPKGETLDPESGVVLANTFYSHFVYEALASRGRLRDAVALMRDRFGPMLDAGATTLWESFAPTASLCHGFSASPTWQMSRRILGVQAIEPGYTHIGVTPDLAGLAQAEGVFPTGKGDVSVSLEATATGLLARVIGPTGVPLTLSAPAGYLAATAYAPEGGPLELTLERV